jgi:hypothetical protein
MNTLATAHLAMTGMATAPLALVGMLLTASGALTHRFSRFFDKDQD